MQMEMFVGDPWHQIQKDVNRWLKANPSIKITHIVQSGGVQEDDCGVAISIFYEGEAVKTPKQE